MTAVAVALLVGGAVPVGAVGGPDGHATGDATVDLDVCLVVLDASVSLDVSVEEGVESAIGVDLDTCTGDGGGWPPGGDDPTPPETPTPTESQPDDGDDGDGGSDGDNRDDDGQGDDDNGEDGNEGESGNDDGDNDDNGNDGSDGEDGNDGIDDGQGGDDADGDGGDDDSTDDDEPNAAPPIEVVSWQVEPKRVTVGEPVVVEATYRNPYWAQQSTIVGLTVDGETAETERLRVPGDGTATTTFEYVPASPGRFRVGIGGLGTKAVRVVTTPTATPSTTPTAAPGPITTETRQQEAAGFDGSGLFAVGLLVSSLLGVAGLRLWRSAPKS